VDVSGLLGSLQEQQPLVVELRRPDGRHRWVIFVRVVRQLGVRAELFLAHVALKGLAVDVHVCLQIFHHLELLVTHWAGVLQSLVDIPVVLLLCCQRIKVDAVLVTPTDWLSSLLLWARFSVSVLLRVSLCLDLLFLDKSFVANGTFEKVELFRIDEVEAGVEIFRRRIALGHCWYGGVLLPLLLWF